MASKKVYAKDIATFMLSNGFQAAMEKFDLKPMKARDVLKAMRDTGVREEDIPTELAELAGRVRNYGYRRDPPKEGESRDYTATKYGRISVHGKAIGIDEGEIGTVKYEKDRIIVTKKGE